MTAIDTSPRAPAATRTTPRRDRDPVGGVSLRNENARLVQRNCQLRAALEAMKLNNAALRRHLARLKADNERLTDALAARRRRRDPSPADADAACRDALREPWSRNP